MDKLSNFYVNSTVTSFKKRLENAGHFENVLVDFDGRAYIRIMKKLTQTEDCKMTFPEEQLDEINLNDEFNQDFHLRYYLPKNIINTVGAKINRVVIMFNGLNELEHFNFYDILGEFFASNDIAAILLPTPLNLNRRIEKDLKKSFYPTSRAEKNNELLFFYSFLKSYKELNFLIDKLKGEHRDNDRDHDFDFYKNYFEPKDIEISLLGYSLGGLKALSYFSNDFIPFKGTNLSDDLAIESYNKRIKQKLHCCITINSGPNLYDVDPTVICIDKKEWRLLLQKVRKKIAKEYDNLAAYGTYVENLIQFYYFLYVNNEQDSEEFDFGHEKIKGILNSYLAISGGSDPIVTTDQMQRISPPFLDEKGKEVIINGKVKKMSINQLIIANVDHHPGMETSDWYEVLPMVEKNVLEFINSCGSRHYKRKDIQDKLQSLFIKLYKFNKNLGEENPIFELKRKFCVKNPPNFSEKDMHLILSSIRSPKDRSLFKRYYYRSKAFFPHFHEVMKKILPKVI